MTIAPNIEALRELQRVVRDAPRGRFDMRTWNGERGECGTVHCALGWAAVDGYFKGKGLRRFGVSQAPFFNGRFGVFAGEDLFGVSTSESASLFAPSMYISYHWCLSIDSLSREVVIDRIQHLIDHYSLERDAHVLVYKKLCDDASRMLDRTLHELPEYA